MRASLNDRLRARQSIGSNVRTSIPLCIAPKELGQALLAGIGNRVGYFGYDASAGAKK